MAESDNLANYLKISTKIRENRVPLVAGLELTYACNLACRHCYVVRNGKPELNTAQYLRLIDDLYDLGTFCLVMTGGEPLLRGDLFEIARYAKQKGFMIVLFTNGTLIDEKTADRIKDCGFWMVEMSLYGAQSKTHDRITRCVGSFEKTLSAVRLLRERKIDINLKTLMMTLNFQEYAAMRDLVTRMNLSFRADIQVNPRLDGNPAPTRFGLSDEQIRSILDQRQDIVHFPCAADEYVDNLTCNAGKQILSVTPDGAVKPCVIYPVACGNIQQNGIKEIWNSGKGLLADLRKIEASDLDECMKCGYKNHCVRCHAAAYLETGEMLRPSPSSCKVAGLRHEQALKKEMRYGTTRKEPCEKTVC